MASRGSPKLLLALSVTSFIDSLHTVTALTCTQHAHLEFDNVSPRKIEHNMGMFGAHRHVGGVRPTVTFPIGDHVNVLHIYKKTKSSTILKLLTCRCHHLIDVLVEFSQNDIFLTILKCLNVPFPSMFKHVCTNYYAHAPCSEIIAKNPSTY